MERTIRTILIKDNIGYVPLTRGFFAKINIEDIPSVSKSNWYAHMGDKTVYAASRINGKIVRMHRLIMSCEKLLEVDHVNGCGLDNRRLNLRIATSSQNKCNRSAGSSNTSGQKGVCLYKPNGKWRSYITVNGRQNSLGYYAEKQDAINAYILAMKKFHGEFAKA